jgi:hypothetical protein
MAFLAILRYAARALVRSPLFTVTAGPGADRGADGSHALASRRVNAYLWG